MAKTKAKKRKLTKKSEKKLEKKPTKKKLKKSIISSTPRDPSSSSSESDSNSDDLQKLLEPYSKDQLIEFICDAAIKDPSLFNRIRTTADHDVSHRKIFIHGLGWDTTSDALLKSFEPFGEIEDCKVVTDRNTGRAKGYGFVLFKTRQGARKALKQPRKKINNRFASCQLASIGPAPPLQNQDTSGRKIYVSNVQADVDPERLRLFFEKFGEIETGPIGFDMQTGKSRGFALFVYKTQEGAKAVLQDPYKMFEGHQLHCRWAVEGKNNVAAQPAQPPVLAAVAAAQNLAMFSQHPGLNPGYSGLLSNPNAGLFTSPVSPMVGASGLNPGLIHSSQVGGAQGLGSNVGSSSSLLGAYGSSGSMLQGLQTAYPNAQASSARVPGSYGGYTSYIWYDLTSLDSLLLLYAVFLFLNLCFFVGILSFGSCRSEQMRYDFLSDVYFAFTGILTVKSSFRII